MMTDDTSHPGLLVIISGPSGVGKTSISRAIRQQIDVVYSVSLTTRPVSDDDTDGEDYVFVSERDFKDQVKLGQMLEWAQVHDNFYGTPRDPVEQAMAAGEVVLLEIDVQGANQVKRNMPDAVGIFVEPPSEAVLLQRLRDRKREDEDKIQGRFARATAEIAEARSLGIYEKTIVNTHLDRAIADAVGFIEQQYAKRQHAG